MKFNTNNANAFLIRFFWFQAKFLLLKEILGLLNKILLVSRAAKESTGLWRFMSTRPIERIAERFCLAKVKRQVRTRK
jgi:hypothetical protein